MTCGFSGNFALLLLLLLLLLLKINMFFMAFQAAFTHSNKILEQFSETLFLSKGLYWLPFWSNLIKFLSMAALRF